MSHSAVYFEHVSARQPSCQATVTEDNIEIYCTVLYDGNILPVVECTPGPDDGVIVKNNTQHNITYAKKLAISAESETVHLECWIILATINSFTFYWTQNVSTGALNRGTSGTSKVTHRVNSNQVLNVFECY